MNLPGELKYTRSHEWVRFLEDGRAEIGLTDFAQKELGDIVFVNLPQEGDSLVSGGTFADVESVKAVSDIFSPIGGTVKEVNEELADEPEKINQDPYGAWLIRASDIAEGEALLSAEEYGAFIAGKEGE